MFKRQKVRQFGTAYSSALLYNKFVLFIYMYVQNGENRIGGVGKKHSLIVLLGWHYTAPFLHSFNFSGCKALFLIDNVPQVSF